MLKQPTRGTATLDQNNTNLAKFYNSPVISSPISLSDHSSVIWIPKQELEPVKVKVKNCTTMRKIRPIKDPDVQEFGYWITHHEWEEVTQLVSVIDKANAFYNTLNQRVDFHFPIHEIKLHTSDKPWVTPKTKILTRRRQAVFIHSRPPLWRLYRNKVIRAIKLDKHEYYHNRVQRLKKSNPAQWYRQIRIMTTTYKQQPSISPPQNIFYFNFLNRYYKTLLETTPSL